MKKLFLLIAIVSAFATAASAQSGEIGVRQWKLVQLNGVKVPNSSKAYLELNADQTSLTGNAGCNRMFGSVEVKQNRVDFSSIGSTRMACEDERVQRLEFDFVKTLENADRFEQSGSSLRLYVGTGLVMKFKAVAKQCPEDSPTVVGLEDKRWALDAINGVTVSKIARNTFVVFDKAKGTASGYASCNVFGGSYTAAGSTLKITGVFSSMRACIEEGGVQIERQFLDGLGNTNRYEIQGGKLMLYQDTRLLLTLTGESK